MLIDRPRHKAEHKQFHVNTRENFFITTKITEHWNRLPRETGQSSSPKISKNPPECFPVQTTVGNLLQQWVGLDDLRRSIAFCGAILTPLWLSAGGRCKHGSAVGILMPFQEPH